MSKKIGVLIGGGRKVEIKISEKAYKELADLKKKLGLDNEIAESIRCSVPMEKFLTMNFNSLVMDNTMTKEQIISLEDYFKNYRNQIKRDLKK